MMFNSDALMAALVFLLLFGAVSLYLYMYLQQVDQKVSLLESILLDMKVSNEIKGFEPPAAESEHASYTPFTESIEVVSHQDEASREKSVPDELAPFEDVEDLTSTAVDVSEPALDYDTATLKELQAVAKARGISTSNVKKSQLIEALKGVEQSGSKSSFLETSAPVSNDE